MMRAQSATEEYCKFYGEHANNVARIDLAIVPDNLYGKSRESASLVIHNLIGTFRRVE